MRFVIWVLKQPFLPRFQFCFFAGFTVLSWARLIGPFAVEPTAPLRDRLAAVIGSFLFPIATYYIWRDYKKAREQAEQPWNHEFWKARKCESMQEYLIRRTSVGEAEDMCRRRVACLQHLFPLDERDLPFLREFVNQELQEGDALWIYDSGASSWEGLHGFWGFAAVREGKIVAFHGVAEN